MEEKLYQAGEIAEMFNKSPDTVTFWGRKGLKPVECKGPSKLFSVSGVHKFLLERELKKANIAVVTEDEKELKKQKLKAETEIVKIEAEKQKGTVIEIGDAIKIMDSAFSNFKAKILQLPDKLSHELALEEDKEEVKRILKQSHDEALNEIAEGVGALKSFAISDEV